MSTRGLGKALRARYPGLRGTSDSGVQHYVGGKNFHNPRLELLRAMADVLGVRWQWLAYGPKEGAPTEPEEQARQQALRIEEAGLPPKEDAQAARLLKAVYSALKLPGPTLGIEEEPGVTGIIHGPQAERPPVWLAPLGAVLFHLLTADIAAGYRQVETRLEKEIGKALAAPLQSLGIVPAEMDRGELDAYVLGMIPVLLRLARERETQLLVFFKTED